MLTLRQIEIFRAIMIAKTVSAAAQMLGTSQPGLSRMLGHMEDKLHFRLFDRTRGRLVPTHEARVLFRKSSMSIRASKTSTMSSSGWPRARTGPFASARRPRSAIPWCPGCWPG
ncbi:LysR family transcriptional regulator [Sphingobium sp. AntQ-1]|uniref:LysR family transcriptional regulator n=1 Tax=Sphingobium sp. AntQ-1 TaxID=2930091 RepID=UPI00234F13CF|nr:LysR family transcriptional regulator [Sphingobium sp. AntQ-1]